ncbi:MAG: NAD(P)H-dependent oxidoreductase subunit E [Lentisphaeria bacterium]|nr:NAD(P)H-dependent oxidoreductase subunit E [Lentisphaeria bacterium]
MKPEFDFLKSIAPEPGNLIKGLQLLQATEGYISEDGIRAAAEYFKRPEADVEGVVSFYAQFKRIKPGKYHISVCDGTACHLKGAPLIHEWLHQELGLKPGETSADGVFSLETVACLGCCSLAPVISVNGKVHGKLDRKTMMKILKEYAAK